MVAANIAAASSLNMTDAQTNAPSRLTQTGVWKSGRKLGMPDHFWTAQARQRNP